MDKKNTFELEIIGSQKFFGDLPALSTYRFNNGRRFPLSYIRFVTKYGYGLTVDLFHIYIPLSEHGDLIFIRSDEIRSTYYEDVVNGDIWFEVAADISLSTLKIFTHLQVAIMVNTYFGISIRIIKKMMRWTSI